MTFLKYFIAVTALYMLAAAPVQSARFEAWARAQGFYSGVSSARPDSDPIGFVVLDGPDLQSVTAEADNFFLNNGAASAALPLRWSNPVDDGVFVSLAFDYVLELYFGSNGLWDAPQPGTYDVTMTAGLELARGDAPPQLLGELTIDQTVTCPSAECTDRYRSLRPVSGFTYIDFHMTPLETVDMTLRPFVSVSASSISDMPAPVPVPAPMPLMLTALAGLCCWARRAA